MFRLNRVITCLLVAVMLAFVSPIVLTSRVHASSGAAVYESARKKLAALNVSENQLSRRDCWLSVIESFAMVYLEYPTDERADDAAYMVGILYERLYEHSWVKGDLEKSVAAFDRLAEEYPASTLADDALFETAEIYRTGLKEPKTAYCRYLSIVKSFPKGDMIDKARARLKELAAYEKTADCPELKKDTANKNETVTEVKKTKNFTRLIRIRNFNAEDHTRVVLDISAAVDFTHGRIKDGTNTEGHLPIYIGIPGGVLGAGVANSVSIVGGQITKIGVESKSDTLRVLLDPDGEVTYKAFALSGPDRIVIDIYGSGWGEGTDASTPKDYSPAEKIQSDTVKVVVLDPGHGGKDPGAVGSTGYYEKTANMKIALYLKEYLEKELGLTVVMTRTTDKYLDLKKRTAIANEAGADLFISIHNNASKNRNPYGISSYYLAVTSDTKALTVAARENDTTIEKLSELDYILTDLMVSAKRNESSLLAKFVQEGMVESVKKGYDNINNIGVCQGPFWVLVGAQMPSILLECSYISNVREEKRLKSDDYLKKLARGIGAGVGRYIKEIDGAHARR